MCKPTPPPTKGTLITGSFELKNTNDQEGSNVKFVGTPQQV